MGNSEKGHWVTVNGRHIFYSDDPAEKQEREIEDSKKRAEEYNKEKQEDTFDDEFDNKEMSEITKVIDKAYSRGDTVIPDDIEDWVNNHGNLNGRKAPLTFICASSVDDYSGSYDEDYTIDKNKKDYKREYVLFKVINGGSGDKVYVVLTEKE